eukprot:5305950-Pyramimonas_sp.AAC.1
MIEGVRQIGPANMQVLTLAELQPSKAFAGEEGNGGRVLEVTVASTTVYYQPELPGFLVHEKSFYPFLT